MSDKNPTPAIPPVENNIMGTAPIPKLLAKFAIPSVISMLVNSIYNLVDQIFIGQVWAIWETQPPMWYFLLSPLLWRSH